MSEEKSYEEKKEIARKLLKEYALSGTRLNIEPDCAGGSMKYKHCWLAQETKKGWKLGLAVGEQPTHWIRGVFAKTEKDIKQLCDSNIVFVHSVNKKSHINR